MKIGWVAPVKPSHPYLENDPAPLFDLHYLRISPWLWFSTMANLTDDGFLICFSVQLPGTFGVFRLSDSLKKLSATAGWTCQIIEAEIWDWHVAFDTEELQLFGVYASAFASLHASQSVSEPEDDPLEFFQIFFLKRAEHPTRRPEFGQVGECAGLTIVQFS